MKGSTTSSLRVGLCDVDLDDVATDESPIRSGRLQSRYHFDDPTNKESTGIIRLSPKYSADSKKKARVTKKVPALQPLPAEEHSYSRQKGGSRSERQLIEPDDGLEMETRADESPLTRDLNQAVQEQYLKVTEEIKLL